MEQRIGRIDRVRSQSDRRLSATEAIRDAAELLQVYYPYLEHTVEVLKVQLVLERMNTFLRLMHEGLSVPKGDHRRVDVSRELVDGRQTVEAIRGRLQSAFPIPGWALRGEQQSLATDTGMVAAVLDRFEGLSVPEYSGLVSSPTQISGQSLLPSHADPRSNSPPSPHSPPCRQGIPGPREPEDSHRRVLHHGPACRFASSFSLCLPAVE